MVHFRVHFRCLSKNWLLLGLVPALMLTGLSTDLQAAFTEIPIKELSTEERKAAAEFRRGGPKSDAAVRAVQRDVQTELSRLTHADMAHRYGTIRKGIINNYLAIYNSKTAGARTAAVSAIIGAAGAIATNDKYSPQARINCLALLAELDDRPATRQSDGFAPPLPAGRAFEPLFAVAKDKNAPLYLKALALHGIERQMGVRWSMWDAARHREVGMTLVGFINSQPNSALDAPAHAWVVRRSFDCLGTIQNPAVADNAITRLGDPKELPSVRMSCGEYLAKLDSSSFTDDQRRNYLISLGHFVRSQLVDWYEREDDVSKRTSGASAGGMGGYMGGDGYGAGAGGGMMGGMMGGMGGGDDYGGEGGYGGMGGMGGMMGGSASQNKPIDTQDWQTLLARRRANQIAEITHLCLNGLPALETKKPDLIGKPLSESSTEPIVTELITTLEAFQTAVNDAGQITDTNSLLTQAEFPIEDIMDLVLDIPGFPEKYPELAEGEGLDSAPVTPPAGDQDPNGSGSDQGTEAPGEDALGTEAPDADGPGNDAPAGGLPGAGGN